MGVLGKILKGFPLWSFSLFSFVVVSICCALGIWQLQRLEWKTNLLNSLSEVSLDSYQAWDPKKQLGEFSKVVIQGRYQSAFEIRLEPRIYNKKLGAYIFSPLLTIQGHLIYVLRGWVDQHSHLPEDHGLKTIYGVVLLPKKPRWFVPKNDPYMAQWHTINFQDVQRFIEHKSPDLLDSIAPFYILEQPQRNVQEKLIPLDIQANIRNDHLQYAVTWFMLAFCIALIYLHWTWKHVKNAKKPKIRVENG